METEHSWKGRIWFAVFIWPFISYSWTKNFFNFDKSIAIYAQIGIFTGCLLFLYVLYRAYALIKKELTDSPSNQDETL